MMDELINQKAELRVIILHYGHHKATMTNKLRVGTTLHNQNLYKLP